MSKKFTILAIGIAAIWLFMRTIEPKCSSGIFELCGWGVHDIVAFAIFFVVVFFASLVFWK